MGIRDTGRRVWKRLTTPTTQPKFGAKLTSAFGFNGRTNPYNNETTWFEIYENEPDIRGAIDSIVRAVVQPWTLESTEKKDDKKPNTKLEKDMDKIKKDLEDPFRTFHTKRLTVVLKLLMDSRVAAETSRVDMDFFTLNAQDWDIIWNERGTKIAHLSWMTEEGLFSQAGTGQFLDIGHFAMSSIHDPNTNLWNLSIMETLTDVANLLFQARKYNLDVFMKGGVPAYLFALDESTSDPSYEQFKTSIKNTKAGQNVISRGAVKAIPIAGFTKDMEYEKIVKFGIQSIMTALGISSNIMNLRDAKGEAKGGADGFTATVHNLQNLEENFWTQVIHNLYGKEPVEVSIPNGEGGKSLIKARPKRGSIETIRFKSRKWTNVREQAALHKIYLDATVFTPNEVRAQLGFEPREGGDEVIDAGNRQAPGNTGADDPNRPDEQKPQDETSGKPQNESNVQSAENA